jgi:hypothetical protein
METETKNVLADHVASMPAVMQQLMADFSKSKDFNSRAKIKQKMKALLDFAAADTEYPAGLQPQKPKQGGWELGGPNQIGFPLPMAQPQGAMMGDYLAPADAGNFLPIPGAMPERDNEDILQ